MLPKLPFWGATQQWSVAEHSSEALASLLSSSEAFQHVPPAVLPKLPFWGATQQWSVAERSSEAMASLFSFIMPANRKNVDVMVVEFID
ncbi:hypothetical protein [Teredinibacter turnerae]|uniref:hypothetical protein n=1 Tax=Teredinibacter turnerae TaxID=2426 RepID=UPI0018AD3CB5|nr:hypothetical protein [Teredinibacter turnerae]